jgi:uncharacterized protein (DUF1330 family)
MTKAYVIAHLTPTNPDRFMSEYMSKVGAVTEAFGGKYLVRGGDISYQEGESLGDRTVVIEFPSADAAHAWESSEQYQAIVKARTENSTGSVIIIDGVPE